MSYLLTQMFLYMLATFLLGLLLGWLIWRYGQASSGDLDALRAERDALAKERDDLQTNLDACRTRSERERVTIEGLRADKIDLQTKLDVAAPVVEKAAVAPGQGTKPEGLSGPRGGVADDLKEISGVGPKLEKLLHKLGYYHFFVRSALSAHAPFSGTVALIKSAAFNFEAFPACDAAKEIGY